MAIKGGGYPDDWSKPLVWLNRKLSTQKGWWITFKRPRWSIFHDSLPLILNNVNSGLINHGLLIRRYPSNSHKMILKWYPPNYPLVNMQIAIENGHWNSEFSHEKWWIFPVRYVKVYQGWHCMNRSSTIHQSILVGFWELVFCITHHENAGLTIQRKTMNHN